LGTEPGTLAAHSVVRAWLQSQLDRNNDPGRSYVSQWLLGQALDVMVSPALRDALPLVGYKIVPSPSTPPQDDSRRRQKNCPLPTSLIL
jgi:hypothetical protein